MKYLDIILFLCIPLYLLSLLTSDQWGYLIAGICLPTIICGWIYYCYKKLNKKLEKIEKQLKSEDKADEDATTQKQTPKD